MSTPMVRSADIAAMANVSRAAVTQWRKRHKDFPTPAEGSDSESPLFDRNEVEQWLLRRGRLPEHRKTKATPAAVAETIADHLRGAAVQDDADLTGAALVAEYLTRAFTEGKNLDGAAQPLTRTPPPADVRPPTTLEGLDPDEAERWLRFLAAVSPEVSLALSPFEAAGPDGAGLLRSLYSAVSRLAVDEFLDVYDAILGSERHRGERLDPPPLSSFLSELVNLCGLSERSTVLDPAVGGASTLLTIGRRHREVSLIGVDSNSTTHAAAIRRAILANRRIDLRVGNSLGDDPAAGVLADAVVVNPPWGLRDFGSDVDVHDPRWAFGRPSPRSDGIWLQHAIAHLADGGRGFVVTTRSELFRTGAPEALRHELLRQGTVEAIIALPAGLFAPHTSIETAIWVLARPGQTVDPDRVLLIDIPTPSRSLTNAAPAAFDAARAAYKRWHTTGEAQETAHSTVVPVRDLLEPNTGLIPKVWIQRRDAPRPEEMIEQIYTAHAALADTPTSVEVTMPDLVPAGMVRREKLTALPGVTVVRGRPLGRHAEADAQTGAPLLSGKILHTYLNAGVAEPDRYVDTTDLPPEAITRSGDIVIAGVTTLGSPAATTIDFPGWVVPPHGFLVRVDTTVSGAPDPDYLVTCINASAHTHARLANSIRVMPSYIEIPVIAPTAQQGITRLVRDLADATIAAEQHLARLRELASLVETATGTGALTTKT